MTAMARWSATGAGDDNYDGDGDDDFAAEAGAADR